MSTTYEIGTDASTLLVFPCQPRSKAPWAYFAAHGRLSAKPLNEWRRVPPDANWGVPCAANGFVVVDVDSGEIPDECTPTYTVKTDRGFHLYYLATPGASYRGKLRDGIDVKHNGYVIAAGSVHPSGTVYEIIDGRSPVPVPVELEGLIRK
jgi:hypothetical protein